MQTNSKPPDHYHRANHNAALTHAYAMGKDYVMRGPTAENTQFERCNNKDLKRAWERGRVEGEQLKTKI